MPTHDSIESLYRDHHHWLKHWLGKKLGCSFQAADLAQDTFVRILGSRQDQLSILRESMATAAHAGRRINEVDKQLNAVSEHQVSLWND